MTSLSYRPAIGIVVVNLRDEVLIGRRNDMEDQWQFPQGGIDPHETPSNAALRELKEETSICHSSVEILGFTQQDLKYDYPSSVIQDLNVKKTWRFAGQQVQFCLLRYHGSDESIDVQNVPKPEFDAWKWVDYWEPVRLIVEFKRDLYNRALKELALNLALKVNQ